MKYFTKEFYSLQYLMNAYSYVRKSELAERKDEEFYKKLYNKQCAIFLRREKMCDWYIDPVKELKKVDEYVNEINITEEERKFREGYRKAFLQVNKDRLETGKIYTFDKELCMRKFEEVQRRLIKIYSQLPTEILEKIADIRVFALGYASAEVKKLLRPYCNKIRKSVNQITKEAFAEIDIAKKYLTSEIDFNDFQQTNILGLEEKDDDILLKFESFNLIVKNGKITEGQCKPIFAYNNEKPNCPWSRVLFAELHQIANKFEVCFLILNLDEIEKQDIWYLTVCGTDLVEITEN